MTHPDLCRLTAEWAIKKQHWLALWEYQSYASQEHPDALIYGQDRTILYEIKMSRADFLADAKKESRIRYTTKVWGHLFKETEQVLDEVNSGYLRIGKRQVIRLKGLQTIFRTELQRFRIEAPHLGSARFFVCPEGMIQSEELPADWGLIWFSEGKFTQKRASGRFRPDVRTERDLVAHALRRLASGDSTGILVRTYAT